ncbi:UNVERIFIED_CONTAM: hypothetical protein HDU68_007361 [Siphonaria sp. JEL0065]|nr:hypothetical protein HDU68_007361 [Siphonaria sp. JEL0065]
MVNILRVQSWDHNFQGPGTAATSALHVAMNYPEVIAAFGDTVGLSTMMTAGVLSQYQIPMCGGEQNRPALSDKGNYPYFFRVSFSNKWGAAIATLLDHWNVKRVALVYDIDDSESIGAYLDIKQQLDAIGITILARRYYHGYDSMIDFTDMLENFKLVDARYIILCAQGWSPSYDLAVRAKELGLISPNHAWIVTNPPFPRDYPGVGEDPRLDVLFGMIWPSLDGVKGTDPEFLATEARWLQFYENDPVKYQLDYINWVNSGPYDCLGTILYGLDKFIRDSGFSADKLSKRGLNSYLNFTVFKDTGFHGTLLNPMRLDENGDITA